MNKDTKGLTTSDQFNLFISQSAIDREMLKIKKPIVNVETIPTANNQLPANPYQTPGKIADHLKKQKKKSGRPSSKKEEQKEKDEALLFGGPAARTSDDIDNEKLSDIMRCLICLKMPVYPKECKDCSILLCDTCLIKYVKTKGRHMPQCPHCKSNDLNAFRDVQSNVLREIIDNVKVAHKCKIAQKQLDIYSIG